VPHSLLIEKELSCR